MNVKTFREHYPRCRNEIAALEEYDRVTFIEDVAVVYHYVAEAEHGWCYHAAGYTWGATDYASFIQSFPTAEACAAQIFEYLTRQLYRVYCAVEAEQTPRGQ
jgi:hypothetical protein